MQREVENDGSILRRDVWPDAVAFREAVQSPTNILIPEMAEGVVRTDRLGLPLAYTGRFAVAFPVDAPSGRWALRCFTTSDIQSDLPREVRYRLLALRLPVLDDSVVPFRFIERGVRIGTRFYPALAMRWADGLPLGQWVETHRRDPERLRRLADALHALLLKLEEAGIAHGDWQHDNLIVSDEGDRVVLVDYDGVFVPDLAGYPSPELGHPNYQHPARTNGHYAVGLDRFACQAIRTALLALVGDATLWDRFGDPDSLLFRAADFRDPDASPLFATLRESRSAAVRQEVQLLESACRNPTGWLPEASSQIPLPPETLRIRLIFPPKAAPPPQIATTPENESVAASAATLVRQHYGRYFRPSEQRDHLIFTLLLTFLSGCVGILITTQVPPPNPKFTPHGIRIDPPHPATMMFGTPLNTFLILLVSVLLSLWIGFATRPGRKK